MFQALTSDLDLISVKNIISIMLDSCHSLISKLIVICTLLLADNFCFNTEAVYFLLPGLTLTQTDLDPERP